MSGLKGGPLRTFLSGSDQTLSWKKVISWWETPTQNPPRVSKYDHRAKVYLGQLENLYFDEQGILCQKWYPQSKGLTGQMIPQVVAPREIRARILQSLHNSPTGAHLDRIKTINCVRYQLYWPGYKEDVINWCCRCDTCAQTKPGPKHNKAKLAQVPVAGPMERVAVDIMGPVPQTDNGNLYILVLGDYFSKWPEAFPLKTTQHRQSLMYWWNNLCPGLG